MNTELAVILLALRTNAISIKDCIHSNKRILKETCNLIHCFNCPLFQDTKRDYYFDKWASIPSHLTVEVKNE